MGRFMLDSQAYEAFNILILLFKKKKSFYSEYLTSSLIILLLPWDLESQLGSANRIEKSPICQQLKPKIALCRKVVLFEQMANGAHLLMREEQDTVQPPRSDPTQWRYTNPPAGTPATPSECPPYLTIFLLTLKKSY